MQLVKALHVIFMVTWFSGLFYLPRLFVYHALTQDTSGQERFKIMERKLYYGIMTPSAILTIGLGVWLLSQNWNGYLHAGWMQAKLGLILALAIYHVWCGYLAQLFARNGNTRSHIWYRWFNEVPVAFLVAIIVLVIVKPQL